MLKFQWFSVSFRHFLPTEEFFKKIEVDFCVIDSEPIVALVYKVMMTSSISLDLDCFELLSLIFFKSKYYSQGL